MKKLLNKKLIIPALLLVFVFVIVVLYRLGFRITYAPELEKSWNAVSAVATWAGVIASFMAIWFAIRVPKQIAEQQNKITLYEKRYEFYYALSKCILLSNALRNLEKPINNETFDKLIVISIHSNPNIFEKNSEFEIAAESIKKIFMVNDILKSGKFLFDFDVESYIIPVSNNLIAFAVEQETISQENVQKYLDEIKKIEEELIPLVEDTLKLTQELR